MFARVDPQTELSWTGNAMGARAVHRNVLSPGSGRTTALYSEESMAGPLLVLFYDSHKLDASLAHWLEAVTLAAERRSA